MHDPANKAFDFAGDLTKQLITLSTGVIALTVSFLKDATDGVSNVAHVLLAAAWGFYLLSIVFGVGTLMGLTGNLGKHGEGEASIYSKNIRVFSGLQIGCFLVAIALTITFGVLAL